MPEISDSAVVQQKLGSLPLVTYQAGDTVLTAGSRSGQLLILKSGAVATIKEDIEIAKVREAWGGIGRAFGIAGSAAHSGRPRFGNVTVSHRGGIQLAREGAGRPPSRCSDPGPSARQRQSSPH